MATDEAYKTAAQVLVVDDEPDHAEVMAEVLHRQGHICTIVNDRQAAFEELAHGAFDLVVTDLVMEGEEDGLAILEQARKRQPEAETILVTAHGDVPTAKAAIKGGAYDFIEKPIDLDVFRALCGHAIEAVTLKASNQQLKEQLDEKYGFEGIIGSSQGIQALIRQMRQIAPSTIPVLVTGESGTGKELVARAIHTQSRRAAGRFVPLNCAGLSESILEDELFGHVRGAFTGAEKDREGRFEYASGGTLFLDEVGDMPLNMQAKLLRVLESGEVVRLGDNEARHVDVRLISATNRDLEEAVRTRAFREDLYFRIKGARLHLPPLRERREDIPMLARHFLEQAAEKMGRPAPSLSESAQRALMQYDWPGNVRQLANVVESMLVIADAQTLEAGHLPPELAAGGGDEVHAGGSLAGLSLEQIEKQAIRDALRLNHGNREETARQLGIGERTLYRKLKEYGLK